MTRRIALGHLSAALAFLLPCFLSPALAQNLLWTRQLGGAGNEGAFGVAVDGSGGVSVCGNTDGSIGGQANAGSYDAFLTRYDASGALLWTRQLGTAAVDAADDVAVDALGNAYITGSTEGGIGGQISAGASDAFLAKYNTAGTLLWTRQLGSAATDMSYGVAVDGASNVYITGYTGGNITGGIFHGGIDAFLAKYNDRGTLLWTRQLGSTNINIAYGVAVDGAGNAYIVGHTTGSIGGQTNSGSSDAFLAKYDASGTLLWTRQQGTAADDRATGVAVDDAGNAYMAGFTYGGIGGQPSAGGFDTFLAKYDASGTLLWTRQFGSAQYDISYGGVAVDSAGNAFVSGYTEGSFGGQTNAGGRDAFLVKYNTSGTQMWTRLLGSAAEDGANAVTVDTAGYAYIAGGTAGSIGGQSSAGPGDAFVAKYIGTCIAASITAQPSSAATCTAGTAIFSVDEAGTGPFAYQWQWRPQGTQTWFTISNGTNNFPTGGHAFVASAVTTPSVTMANFVNTFTPVTGDRREIQVVVSNFCGSATSNSAVWTVCPADFNCDGVVSVPDIFAFLSGWFASDPTANVNGANGINVQDIFDFLNAWFAGC